MLKCIPLDSLKKVFHDEEPRGCGFGGFSLLLGERGSFQAALFSDADAEIGITALSPLNITACEVVPIPSNLAMSTGENDDYFKVSESGLYPDLLRPICGKLRLKAGQWKSVWFEIAGDSGAGQYGVSLRFSAGAEEASAEIAVEIIGAALPEQTLICTHWFHTDCLSTRYKAEVFSEEYWRIVENYVSCAVQHGINFILTPLFTPPLDTEAGGERPTVQLTDVTVTGRDEYEFGFDKLKRWVEMCDRCGVKYFEMSHLFTQWGAMHAPKIMAFTDGKEKQIFGWKTWAASQKYTAFLRQFARALNAFIDAQGIRERCFFHVSDEPGQKDIRAYQKRAALINEIFPGCRVIDALSDYDFYKKGIIKNPIPANNHIEPFIGNVPELWTYYCCGQHSNYVSNRFFSMPSQRNRVLGYQMYKFDVKGFLQWGYNFWYSCLSLFEIDPFETSDAGGAFPSGDAYVVYPGDGGQPLVSLRLKVFYDAIQDMRALQLLESLIGREKTVSLLESDTGGAITFSEYPRDDQWHLAKREEINAAIKAQVTQQ
ncbi:MAG: DUF4091 domain-containing protein [Oscillospiraceae bacterium]|nr:DUF4091 domain-containing protein [Oscillospiraceae bacterium]